MSMQILSRTRDVGGLGEMMNHALKYAADGFYVFPVYEPIESGVCSCTYGALEVLPNGDKHSKGKHPRTQNGVSDATTDSAKIKEWWSKWPKASIGIATGKKSGLAVIDLDGPEGILSGKQLRLQSMVQVITGNGEQLYYADPNGSLTNSVKKLAVGIDTRGIGGYVIAPPSLHPNGKRYVWKMGPLSRTRLTTLPSYLSTVAPSATSTLMSTIRKDSDWMEKAIEDMKRGHVHNTLISVLGKFRSHNFSEESTYTFLKPYALVNGQPFEGLRDKISEIWKRYPQNATQNGTEDIESFLEQSTEVEWLCKPYFAKKSIGFVAGLPETLKTWLLIDLAVELTQEHGLWLGLLPTASSRVLFIDQERFKGETQRRFAAVIAAKGLQSSALKGKLAIKCGTHIKINLNESFQAFRRELLDKRPDVVIVDSFATFHSAPENDRMEIQKVFDLLKQLRDEIGCSFIFINHENKSAYPNGEPQDEPHIGTMAGSVAIPAASEVCLTVRKVEEGTSIMWHTKSTLAKRNKPIYVSIMDTKEGIQIKAIDE